MNSPFGPADVDRFRLLVGHRLGLHFDDGKLGFLAELLARRIEVAEAPASLYLDRLEGGGERHELQALARALTVAETYFFRNTDQFRAFAEVVIPDRMAARASTRRLRVLSAGCASGEEPYSLAVVLRERVVEPAWDVSIRAVDVNPAMLEKAARARYSTWALRETPEEIRRRWFKAEGRDFALDESLRTSVRFQERNLAHDDAELWTPESYDVVFCRNVIMYFTPEQAQAVVGRITRALAPGGYLFFGHAETLRGVSGDYHLRHTHGTFYYQRRDGVSTSIGPAMAPWAPTKLPATEPLPDLAWATTWIETVQRASERIRALAERPVSSVGDRVASSPASTARPSIDLTVALELLRKERFSHALELLDELPAESAGDPDVLLLRAVLLTHSGQLGTAETVCAKLLELDEFSTGAHYLLALCREGSGDRHGAIDHDQVAAYLDPGFAMPRLHLGLMARRAGDRDGARRELGQALVLLQREDPSRLLLLGGGFGRDALVALCRAELAAAGGRS
jgi:chemotaxis protein methyltransferase CheR